MLNTVSVGIKTVGILGKSTEDVTPKNHLFIYCQNKNICNPIRELKIISSLGLRAHRRHGIPSPPLSLHLEGYSQLRSNRSYHQNQSRPHPVPKHSPGCCGSLPLCAWDGFSNFALWNSQQAQSVGLCTKASTNCSSSHQSYTLRLFQESWDLGGCRTKN